MKYVNIKLDQDKGVSTSVDFKVFSDSHKVAGTGYHLSLSDTPEFAKVFEAEQDAEWRVWNNGDMFKPAAPGGEE